MDGRQQPEGDHPAAAAADGTTPLHAAAAAGHTMLALALLRSGCCRLSQLDAQGKSACQVAIERGFEQTALALFNSGAQREQARLLS